MKLTLEPSEITNVSLLHPHPCPSGHAVGCPAQIFYCHRLRPLIDPDSCSESKSQQLLSKLIIKYTKLIHIDPVLLLAHVIFFESFHPLFLSLPLEFTLVCFFVVSLLFWAEHVGNELVAQLLRIDFALDSSFFGELSNLMVQHFLYLRFIL
jgi:hypothetical protein